MIEIDASISHIHYTPTLSIGINAALTDLSDLEQSLANKSRFDLGLKPEKRIAISRWVSPKRTRSYPYANIYDMLHYNGKKVTVIPIIKDEGIEGERDYLQWDTISLMSLLGVYVIVAFYSHAVSSKKKLGKITKQRFDIGYVKQELARLDGYLSSPLHWNYEQTEKISEVAQRAVQAYSQISITTGVEFRPLSRTLSNVKKKFANARSFRQQSRKTAVRAQSSESQTTQPLENVSGDKGKVNIRNHLGGVYNLTVDEVLLQDDNTVHLVEAKHSSQKVLPSINDIKDALIKMVLFTNFDAVSINGSPYKHRPVLKLTSDTPLVPSKFTKRQEDLWIKLQREAQINNFEIKLN